MQFKLVAAGTSDFVNNLEHDFTVMDLDYSKVGMMESITTSGFVGTPTANIIPAPAGDVSYAFKDWTAAQPSQTQEPLESDITAERFKCRFQACRASSWGGDVHHSPQA